MEENENTETKTYTFDMPGEERFFLQYFHFIACTALVIFSALGVLYSAMTIVEAFFQAVIFVAPVYIVYFVFGKRFAGKVTLDFEAQKVHFAFTDERGILVRDFKEVRQIHFQYYLTFVLDEAKIMVKRPANKQEIFEMLSPIFSVNRGIFAGLY